MPTTVTERMRNRLSADKAEIIYLVDGASGPAQARTLALEDAPETYAGVARDDAEAAEIEGAAGAYDVTVSYGGGGGGGATAPEWTTTDSFEVALTPTLVTHSRATIGSFPEGPEALPNFKGAIGVDLDGRVNGVQWPPSPAQVISRSRVVAAASVTESYYRAMSALAGHVNSAAYLGFNDGELLFLGASGTRRGVAAADPWEITWKFGVSLNATNIPVGSAFTVPTKKGWHYLWVYFRPFEDATSKLLVQWPYAAYVEQIAPESSFAGLILTAPPPDP